MRATIVDISKRTGLSLATISKYMNGGNVRPENREKIEEAIEFLHYRVNETARSLVTNRTRTIGVIVYTIENLFAGTLVRSLGTFFRKHGYGLFICDSNEDERTERENILAMIRKNVDGIILMPVGRDSRMMRPIREAGIPAVCLDRKIEGSGCPSVTVTNEETMADLTRLVIEKGHQRIAYIGSTIEYTGSERLSGFRKAMKEADLEILPGYEHLERHSLRAGYQGMTSLLQLQPRPTAVLLGNYEISLGAVMAVHDSGYTYPKDISMAAFDNLMLMDVVYPHITTAVQPTEEMAVSAGEMLLEMMEAPDDQEMPVPEDRVLAAKIQKYDSISEPCAI